MNANRCLKEVLVFGGLKVFWFVYSTAIERRRKKRISAFWFVYSIPLSKKKKKKKGVSNHFN